MEDALEEIADVILRRGAAADPAEARRAARAWAEAGFNDPSEVGDWLEARCHSPESARLADDAGLTPEQARLRTRAGAGGYEDTIGHKLARGDLTVEEARRAATSAFWND